MSFGAPHRHFRRTDSTNARARELVEAGAPHGTVVTATEQTAGRGRQGRAWTAPPGKALLYSAILRPLDERHLLLPLSVPLAVCEAAEELEPRIECAIKWPNDIWVEERKLAGVLIEAKPQDGWAVIGVGLNLTIAPDEFPPELRDTAISLFDPSNGGRGSSRRCLAERRPGGLSGAREAASKSHRPKGGDRHSSRGHATAPAATALNRHLDRWVAADRDDVLTAWRSRDALRGREISWDGGSGVADGIEDSGDLVVVAAGGDRVVLGAGEVHLRL
ncbi:MAG TPA: biotin--[acetyl-CoA-carboxylase] ligase [Solirubrobacterales bacterium]|nr:biotin--[acetyl-CoA-carboxylase] ligase [Solirubrobacterales bacterium]